MYTVLALLFIIKVCDNILTSYRSIALYKNQKLLSSFLTIVNQLMFYFIISKVISNNTLLTIIVVAVASGLGNNIAMSISEKFEKDSKYTNYITSSNIDFMYDLNDYIVDKKIRCILCPSYNRRKEPTLVLTIFANTKYQSKIIDDYLKSVDKKDIKYLREISF